MDVDVVSEAWKGAYRKANSDIFGFDWVKPLPSEWVEANIWLPDGTTAIPGPYRFDWTPYMREILDRLHPSDPTRYISVMKCVQSGATAGVVIPGICYIIDQIPDNILFTAGDINLAAKTIEERLDPILRASKLDHNIRPAVIKKKNARTGDTSKKKEYAGGTLTALGTNSATSFRMYSTKYNFADDWDAAPRGLQGEGSPKKLIEGRQTTYENRGAKSFFISTSTDEATSNIWETYQLGTMRLLNWPCPECGEYFPLLWDPEHPENSKCELVWELDIKKKLVPGSVRLKCPHCEALIKEDLKYELNLKGEWIPSTDDPVERFHESYMITGLMLMPGSKGWEKIVENYLQAAPPDGEINVEAMITVYNLDLGLPYRLTGESLKANELMKNCRKYLPGVIPDVTCEADGNGRIILLTLACDLNGIMKANENEDVRLDWELLGHSSTGATYSIDQGSIGTFVRKHLQDKTLDKGEEAERIKWTYTHDAAHNVWGEFEKLMAKSWPLESELATGVESDVKGKEVALTVIDTGHFTAYAKQFISNMQQKGFFCFGVKGHTEENYRPDQKDANPVKRSVEMPKQLYIVQVNPVKEALSRMMALRIGMDGTQPDDFMNFPEPRDGKYGYENYFQHYESEERIQATHKTTQKVVGYKWDKKNSTVANHFWDVRVYNLAAREIYLQELRQDKRYKNITWEEFVVLVTG